MKTSIRIFKPGSDAIDPNPELDEGNPFSSSGIEAGAQLYHILGIRLELDPARHEYARGWGGKALVVKPIRCCWTLPLQDINGRQTTITFDLFDDDS